MMRVLKNKKGTTLVELVVCMVLLSLFTLAAVTLIQPSAQAYMQVQQQTRAQNLADALIETIRGELLNANGYIRFADGATDITKLDAVFKAKNGAKPSLFRTVQLVKKARLRRASECRPPDWPPSPEAALCRFTGKVLRHKA